MLLHYQQYFFRYGVRKVEQLSTPPLGKQTALTMPRASVYHYLGASKLDDGPTDTFPILRDFTKVFPTQQVFELATRLGNPIRQPVNEKAMFRGWRLANPRFRPFMDFTVADRDLTQCVVFNYSYLLRMYRYMRTMYTAYHVNFNHMATMWAEIGRAVTQTERHHFVEVSLPEILPSVSTLRMSEMEVVRRTIPLFSSPEGLMILELWRWLGPHRQVSMLNKIPKERLSRVNLVVKESGRWMVLNLGLLNAWRRPSKAELEENPDLEEKGLAPDRMQMRMLFTMVKLLEARTIDVPENLGDDPTLEINKSEKSNIDPAGGIENTTVKVTTPEAKAPAGTDPNGQRVKVVRELSELSEAEDLERKRNESFDSFFSSFAQDMDRHVEALDTEIHTPEYQQMLEELEKLELANTNVLDQVEEDEAPLTFDPSELIEHPKTHEQAVIDLAQRLLDRGSLSPGEMNRIQDTVGDYTKLKAPDGTTLGTFSVVPAETLVIKEPPKIKDITTVTDKSMLSSTLLEFDSKYVKDVMQRDIAAMVTNIMQAGYMVQGYDVEEIEDITGSYFAYAVRIKPIQGVATTIRFNMPKVNPDGTYKVNGVTYRQRKQRGDMPIRKVSPNRVALTSYLGKLFVERSEKKVNDYGRWLHEHVMRLALDPENNIVTNIVPGNVFQSGAVVPRLYSILANGFRSLTLLVEEGDKSSQWNLTFDFKNRGQLLNDPSVLEEIEGTDHRFLGKRVGAPGVMVVGNDNQLYEVTKTKESVYKYRLLPSIEEILDLLELRVPLDQIEVGIFSKSVSLGVMLGYLMGLEKLCQRLGVKPRVVPAGTRANPGPDEWTIIFQDETWVFQRSDRIATLVLSGWRDYSDTTRQFFAHDFNRDDVYLKVLEDHGMTTSHLREMTTINQLFIDPTTRDLLKEMGEPQVMTELLLRCAELLLTDYHPDELDARYTRIKGYERFSGILYSELVRSIRGHRARANKNAHGVEMNPLAVFLAISGDQAKNQVSEINPVEDLKGMEAVTYSGHGGRSGRSLVKRTRAQHKSDVGTISEATVDSSDVAINVSLSANPQFTSLRGTTKPYDYQSGNSASVFSTSALLAPSADKDDRRF